MTHRREMVLVRATAADVIVDSEVVVTGHPDEPAAFAYTTQSGGFISAVAPGGHQFDFRRLNHQEGKSIRMPSISVSSPPL